jgi:YegS/Rv2252/BmrU family lipid kinase
VEVKFATTRRQGEAVEIARRAAGDGYPLVVAVGGDGTVNEVINGLVDQSGKSAAVLGCLFTGRGCDGVRNFSLPRDLRDACRRLVEGQDLAVDLGLVRWGRGGERCFIGSAGAGFDTAVAQKAQVGTISGIFSYLPALVTSLATYRNQQLTVEADGQTLFDGPTTAVVIANGAYFGGGMKIAPGALPTDGKLDLVLLRDLGAWEILRWLPSVYWGKHLANPKISTHQAQTVRLSGVSAVPCHLDGEVCGETPLSVSVLPGALRLRC